jgi:hypothetical protein
VEVVTPEEEGVNNAALVEEVKDAIPEKEVKTKESIAIRGNASSSSAVRGQQRLMV